MTKPRKPAAPKDLVAKVGTIAWIDGFRRAMVNDTPMNVPIAKRLHAWLSKYIAWAEGK